MPELLCPAGSTDALRAAVCNGADAVYLGVQDFNARHGARNFTMEELPEVLRYCHARSVKVYLTLNTLVSDREMEAATKVIAGAAAHGIDAFIVQDLGIVSLCRQVAPSVPIHASTQMSVHSLEGVRQAAQMGITRVVLARELSGEAIAYILRNSPIEIEVFVHGAFCMCYSGQCYMSALIGRRSGNRGQCAQPCRLPYGYDRFEEKYPLSLKDNCLIRQLRELTNLGVASLKIEGRMKRPEYVAVVTDIYRRALDEGTVTPEAMSLLEAVFSRQGFTQDYYYQKTGPQMFGTRLKDGENKTILQAARASYENVESQRVPVDFYAIVSAGQPVQLAAQDDLGNVCKTVGELPEAARTRALSQEELQERLRKTGGTPFFCRSVRCLLDRDLSVPAAEINRLRREVLTQLLALRGRSQEVATFRPEAPQKFTGSRKPPVLTVSITRTEQITSRLRRMKPALLYVPIHLIMAEPNFYTALAKEQPIAAVLPRVLRDSETPAMLAQLLRLRPMGITRVLVGNIGQIEICRARDLEVCGDFGLNVFNSRSMAMQKKLGLSSATVSFEMTLPQIRDLSKPLPAEMIVYGRLPLMLTENCLMKNRSGICSCQTDTTRLIDRIGEEFPIIKDGDTCRSVILNGKKLYLLDKKDELRKLGLWALRLSFTTENPAEIDGILADWQSGGQFEPGSGTRGLYLRGVE